VDLPPDLASERSRPLAVVTRWVVIHAKWNALAKGRAIVVALCLGAIDPVFVPRPAVAGATVVVNTGESTQAKSRRTCERTTDWLDGSGNIIPTWEGEIAEVTALCAQCD
jgi:hypothetical protein